MPTDGPHSIAFFVLAAVTLASAICAMSLRNLVHCGLCLALTFAGLAAVYLQLSAEFVGLAQILVYVGAVAILIVFTILLTRNAEVHISPVSRSWIAGLIVALIVCASLAVPLMNSPSLNRAPAGKVEAPVKLIGEKLMTQYVIPLEAIALVLTAALLGAVVIAMRDEPEREVGRGVLSAQHSAIAVGIERSDTSPRRAEDSAPYHDGEPQVTVGAGTAVSKSEHAS